MKVITNHLFSICSKMFEKLTSWLLFQTYASLYPAWLFVCFSHASEFWFYMFPSSKHCILFHKWCCSLMPSVFHLKISFDDTGLTLFLHSVYVCNSLTKCWLKLISMFKIWTLLIPKYSTVNFLNIRTPKKFVVITLEFELYGSIIQSWVQTMQTEWQTV